MTRTISKEGKVLDQKPLVPDSVKPSAHIWNVCFSAHLQTIRWMRMVKMCNICNQYYTYVYLNLSLCKHYIIKLICKMQIAEEARIFL
jgi:hypothetical protein